MQEGLSADVCQRLLAASPSGTSPDVVLTSQHTAKLPLIPAHNSPPALRTASLAAAQQHSCRSRCHLQSGPLTPTTGCVAPALCLASTQRADTSLSTKAQSSITSPQAGQFQSVCCTHTHTHTHALSALSCACLQHHCAPMVAVSLFWPAQQASFDFPLPTAIFRLPEASALPEALTQQCAFLQAFQLHALPLWQGLPFQKESRWLSVTVSLAAAVFASACCTLRSSCLLHIEMLLCPVFAINAMLCCTSPFPVWCQSSSLPLAAQCRSLRR